MTGVCSLPCIYCKLHFYVISIFSFGKKVVTRNDDAAIGCFQFIKIFWEQAIVILFSIVVSLTFTANLYSANKILPKKSLFIRMSKFFFRSNFISY